jgi:PAS domain S-box-containing protein
MTASTHVLPSPIARYFSALAVVGVALLITLNVDLISNKNPFSLFFAAAILATWFGGRRVGVASVAVSAVLCDYLIIPPIHSLIPNVADAFQIATFGIVAIFLVLLTSGLQHREHATAESELRYRTLFEYSPDGILIADPQSYYLDANPTICSMLGYKRHEIVGMHASQIVTPQEIQHIGQALEIINAGDDYKREWQFRRKDGSVFQGDVTATKMPNGNLLAVVRDVTEYKTAEGIVRDSESRLAGIIDSAMDAIITVDSEQIVQVFNRAAEAMFGCPASEAIGGSLKRFVPIKFRDGHSAHIQSFGRTGVSTRAMAGTRAIFGLRANGEEFPLEASISQVEAGGKKLFTVVMRDISESQRAEKRFQQIIEHAPHGKLLVDEEGKLQLVNAKIEELFGYSRDELIGQPIELLVPKRFHKHHATFRKGFSAEPSPRTMGSGRELFGVRKDGGEFPVEIGLNPLQTEQGMMVLGTIVDITKRKEAEDALTAAQSRLSSTLLAGSIGTWTWDIVTDRLSADEFTARMFSLDTAAAAKGLPVQDYLKGVYTEDQPTVSDALAKAIESCGRYDIEYRVHRPNDELKWLQAKGRVDCDGAGKAISFHGAVMDITSRKQAEESLRRSQQQLAGIIDSAMDAIITVNDEQRIVLFNSAAEKMFIYPSNEAIGQPLDRFIPKRFRPGHQRHIEEFGNTHITRRSMGSLGALFGLRSDGEEFPIEASISQIESDGRKLYTVILRDIAGRKQAEEALKEQARILDLAPVLIRNLQGEIIFWNTGAELMYGWSSEEAIGKNSHELFRTTFPEPLDEIRAKVFARGNWEGEFVHSTRDGRRITVASNWVLHKNQDDEPKAILEVNNDVTDRKQAEREVRRLNEELEQRVLDRTEQLESANKELEAFSYSVSHDLRAPLRHIDGFVQLLTKREIERLDDTSSRYLKTITDAVRKMGLLIDGLLAFSRTSRQEIKAARVDLAAVLRDTLRVLSSMTEGRTINWRTAPLPLVEGDAVLLSVVMTNLLSNAIKFTGNNSDADIEVGFMDSEDELVTVFVRDNGAGFDMRYADKLFGVFQRMHRESEFDGIGIGLATVQRIINRHGGSIWAESEPGKGAAFYFTLRQAKGEKE